MFVRLMAQNAIPLTPEQRWKKQRAEAFCAQLLAAEEKLRPESPAGPFAGDARGANAAHTD